MLFLKAFSCMVICFGMVQTKCIENILIEKVLESNISNTEKLEQVNKIVRNGLLHEENSEQTSSNKGPPIHQLPDTPTSELWNPYTNLERTEQHPDVKRKDQPGNIPWNPWGNLQHMQEIHPKSGPKIRPSVAWDPWGFLELRIQNSEPTKYQLPIWNPLDPTESQLNSYRSSFPNQISNDRLPVLNLQKSMNNNDGSIPYYDDRHPDMDPVGPYSLYSNQFQPSVSSENNPVNYNMLKNQYS